MSLAPRSVKRLIGCLLMSLLCACSAASAQDSSAAQVTLTLMRDVIGKTEQCIEVRAIEKVTGLKPERRVFDNGVYVYLIWPQFGVEVFLENQRVRTVFLRNADQQLHSFFN